MRSHSCMGLRYLVECACRVLDRVYGIGIGVLTDGIEIDRQVVVRLSEAGMLLQVGWGLGLELRQGRGRVWMRAQVYLKVR